MPAKPRWLLRVPEIIEALSALPTPWVDRAVVERLFDLRRRRAIQLLHAFEGFQVGRTFLADREAVLAWLRAVESGADYHWEEKRRQRLGEKLAVVRRHVRAARVSITPQAAPGWPSGVHLDAGRMVIDYDGVQDLLAKLYGLARAAAEDFEQFQNAVRRE